VKVVKRGAVKWWSGEEVKVVKWWSWWSGERGEVVKWVKRAKRWSGEEGGGGVGCGATQASACKVGEGRNWSGGRAETERRAGQKTERREGRNWAEGEGRNWAEGGQKLSGGRAETERREGRNWAEGGQKLSGREGGSWAEREGPVSEQSLGEGGGEP